MAQQYHTEDRPIPPPIVAEAGATLAWDEEADVVIVGFGGAGVAAAIEAREQGAEVIAIDRFDGGGATRYSGGVVYAGGGTWIQQEAGVSDTPAEMAKYLAREVGDAAGADTIRRYAEGSSAQLEWLASHGVPFDSTFYKEKIVYPPEGYFLQYSGNEKAYAEYAAPAARGHRTVGPGFTGVVFYDRLRAAAERIGVRVRTHTPVTRLVVDAQGNVIGVEARAIANTGIDAHRKAYFTVNPMSPFNAGPAARASRAVAQIEDTDGRVLLIRARRGVVLSTGGFSHNLGMLQEHVPFIAQNIGATMRMASLGCDGSGIRLGASAGGTSKALDRVYVGRVMAPPSAFLHGAMVNRRGERFVGEDAYNSIVGQAIFDQPGGEARLIVTSEKFWSAVRECLFSGWATFRFFGGAAMLNILFGGTRSARSVEKLARKTGRDAAVLHRTIENYNATVGAKDQFGKLASSKSAIVSKRYYAINFSIPNRFAFTQLFTMGGLSVDEESGTVLRADGRLIPGLYAAGRAAYGLCSHNYVSGLSLGDCVFSGRRAARHAAARVPDAGRAA